MKTLRPHFVLFFYVILFLMIGTCATAQKTSKSLPAGNAQSTATRPEKATTSAAPVKTSKPAYSVSAGRLKSRTTKATNPRTNIQVNSEERANTQTAPSTFHEEQIQNNPQEEITPTPAKSENQVLNRKDLYQNFWRKYNVQNGKQAAKQMRHCGCAGDIEYVNVTRDTLNFYFAYLTPLETPTLEDAVLPAVKYNHPFAAFFLAPGDSATVRGSCMGGLQYEVTTRKNRFTGQGHNRPDVYINKFVRLSCMPKTLIISEDMEGFSE